MLVKSESRNKEIRYNKDMKEQTIAQFLNVKDFLFVIKDKNGNIIYFENSDGYWSKWEHDDQGNKIRYENSDGYWRKSEYDDEGNAIYYEDSDGVIVDERPKPMIELTLQDIAKLKGVSVNQIRIKE
jgi:transcriptional regulator with XRE-family HTH domain